MRPLSRLLSVFLALILMGLSVMVASGDAATDATGDADSNKGGDYVLLNVDLVSEEGSSEDTPAHVNDKLEFLVTVYRLDGAHVVQAGELNGPFDMATFDAATDDDTSIPILDDQNSYREATVHYTIQTTDLGNADSRMVTFTWEYEFNADNSETDTSETHEDQSVKATVDVYISTRPGADEGVSEVLLDFADPAVPEIEKGNEIKFTLVVSTGKYGLIENKSFTIMRQYKDADGDNDGAALPVAGMTINALGSNATGKTIKTSPEAYKLQPRDIEVLDEGGSIEFSYKIPINEADIGSDLNKDGDYGLQADGTTRVLIAAVEGTTDSPIVGDARTTAVATIATHDVVETREGIILTLPVAAPEEDEEEVVDNTVGMTDSATVTKGEGNLIDIMRHDGGANFSLGVGFMSADGMVNPHTNGYIRDNDLGQTYAVVNRESDGMIVRVWVSSSSPLVGMIDWSSVLDFYNVPTDVLNAIPLDSMHPATNQLVKAGDPIYVYTGGKWRHIPDIPTFQSRGYYWCDVTTASEGWADNVDVGQALPSVGGEADPDYPVCRS